MNNNTTANSKKTKILDILKQLETKGNVKNSLLETGKSLVIGVGGAAVGAAIGKPSFLAGLGATIAGHYMNYPRLTTFGVGMMACGGFQIGAGVNGTSANGLEGMKERVKAFGSNLKQSLYIDKFIKPKKGTDGLGEVQYFKYPGNELDMGALNSIEDEIMRSSEQAERLQMSGSEDEVSGSEDDISGVEDQNY